MTLGVIGKKLGMTQIFDEQGNEIVDETGKPYKWVTTSEAKVITKLPIGNYVLKEIEGTIPTTQTLTQSIQSYDVYKNIYKDNIN